jgi:hypothetical protein
MTGSGNDDTVGYGRPPKHTRWKKGQSGDPRKAKPKRAEDMVTLIDRLLLAPVKIVKNGVPTRTSAMDAIVQQLLQKSLSGNKKATHVLREFDAFARRNMTRRLEVVFVDNEYTSAFASSQFEGDDV